MKKTNKILTIILLISILFSNITTIFAKSISQSEKINLVNGHDCVSVLKIIGEDRLKQVAYVYYEDPDTHIRYPAFCVEPADIGLGTGAGDSYDVQVSQLDNPVLWRILYYGYVGSNYQAWGLECDDDLYFATKTAVHCFAEGTNPYDRYEIPHRVGHGDEEYSTLEDIQRRGQQVLDVSQTLLNMAYANANDNYICASVSVEEQNEQEEIIDGTKYLIKNYVVNSNKELASYDVGLIDFPADTRILNNDNVDSITMTNSNFKVAIPVSKLTENFTGLINVYNAKVKSYPVFYGTAPENDYQDYIFIDPIEITSARSKWDVDIYKSTLRIVKSDDDGNPVEGAVFNIKYEDGTNIGDFTTDTNGIINIENLKQGNIVIKEISVPDKYILDSSEKNVKLEFNSTRTLDIINDLIKGQIKVIKTSKDDNKINGQKKDYPIPDVKFEVYDSNKNIVDEIVTDENGIAITKMLKKGTYYIKEVEAGKWYLLNTEEFTAVIKNHKQIVNLQITNDSEEPDVEIEKTGIIQTTANQEIKYDFKFKNTGNVPLSNFTWTDELPTDYVRITKLITGTYNQDLNYNIYYKTNLNDYKLLKENLNTKINHYIDFTNIVLEEDEYITNFKIDFGDVDVGFESEINPYIFVKTLDSVKNDDIFTNKTRIEGNNKGYLVWNEDDHTTKLYEKEIYVKKLPRTGY